MHVDKMESMGSRVKRVYNLFVGTETGILKGVNSEKQSWENLSQMHEVTKEREITAMCWENTQQTQICLGRRDQSVTVYDTESGEFLHSHQLEGGTGRFRGLAKLDDSYITCTESGLVKLWKDNGVEINAGENIHRMRQNPQERHLVATGGKENDLKIWDLQNPAQPMFRAKNVRNDFLNLRVPVWVTDMAFLPDSQKIVTCTGHHQVRLYDPGTPQKRPVIDFEFDEYPFTAMGLRPGQMQVIVGNTHGQMALIDLRGKGLMLKCYKGFAGAIRSIECHSNRNVVASCGLDRFLRLHDIEEKTLLQKFYLKSRLNCLLFTEKWPTEECTAGPEQLQQDEEAGDVDDTDEVEDIWDNMPVVGKKKRQSEETDRKTGKRHKKTTKSDQSEHEKAKKTKRKEKSLRKKQKRIPDS